MDIYVICVHWLHLFFQIWSIKWWFSSWVKLRVHLNIFWEKKSTEYKCLIIIYPKSDFTVNFKIKKFWVCTWNCTMTNVIHKFLIYLSVYICLACFGLSFSPSSEEGVQLQQWFKSPGYGVSARALELLPKLYTCLWRWVKRKPETCKAKVNR
jgi:hypothetical protein